LPNEKCEQDRDNYNYLFLTSEDRADGFAIEADEHSNIMLLKGSKLLAQFSRALNKETVRAFVKLVKDYELRGERLASRGV